MGLDISFIRRKNREIGYFRKVNFLVRFFANKGMDIYQKFEIEVTKEMIEELKDKCQEVLDDHSKAPLLLPTMSGFFFGSTEYDDWYFNDIEKVLDYCNTLLPEFNNLKDDESIIFYINY